MKNAFSVDMTKGHGLTKTIKIRLQETMYFHGNVVCSNVLDRKMD